MNSRMKGKTIFLDTAPLIYYIENNKEFSGFLNPLFELNDKGVFRFVTSVITLTETLIHPIQKKEMALAKKYENILRHSSHLDLIEINSTIASKAAGIRAQYGFKTPDAIQLAVAQSEKAY
jgi:predicted nucleic acid-binding protein